MTRKIQYQKNNGGWEDTNLSNPFTIGQLNNDQEYSIKIRISDNDEANFSLESDAVQGTPEEPEGIPTFDAPPPTLLRRRLNTGDTITVDYSIENLDNSFQIHPSVKHMGLWDANALLYRRGTKVPGDPFKGTFTANKLRDIGETSEMASYNYPLFSRSIIPIGDTPGATDQDWEDAFTQWANAWQNLPLEMMGGVIITDEPEANEGYDKQRLTEVIDIGKSVLPEGCPIGFTITYGSVLGTSGTNQGWPENANFIHLNHYPYLDDNSGGPAPLDRTKSAFMSTSNVRALPKLLIDMAQKMENDNIDPNVCKIGVTGQAYEGTETFGGQNYNWVWPPLEAPLWWAEAISDFNSGVYNNRGYQVDALMWWPAWGDNNNLTGMRGGRTDNSDYPDYEISSNIYGRQYFDSIKKIDFFGRSPASISQARVSWLNDDTGVIDYAEIPATVGVNSYTITGLDPNARYGFWVQSIINGELSGVSNLSVRQ